MRHYFRIRIRTLLILTALFASVLGWCVSRRPYWAAMRRLESNFKQARYDWKRSNVHATWLDRQLGIYRLDRPSTVEYWCLAGEDISFLEHLDGIETLTLVVDSPIDLSPLGGLTRLAFLDVVQNGDEHLQLDFGFLKDLRKLQSLDIERARFSDLRLLEGMEELRLLDLQETQVSDLTPLRHLQRLESLNLSLTQISDIRPLGKLRRLTGLSIANTNVDDLAALSSLSNLLSLDCGRTRIITLDPIEGFARLKSLGITATRISDIAPLVGMPELEELSIDRTRVRDLTPLLNCRHLKRLNLSYTPVESLVPLTSHTELTSIRFVETSVSDSTPLGDNSNLMSVIANGSRLANLDFVATTPALKFLYIQDTKITDLSPLRRLSRLENLVVGDSQKRCLRRSPIESMEAFLDRAADAEVAEGREDN